MGRPRYSMGRPAAAPQLLFMEAAAAEAYVMATRACGRRLRRIGDAARSARFASLAMTFWGPVSVSSARERHERSRRADGSTRTARAVQLRSPMGPALLLRSAARDGQVRHNDACCCQPRY